MVSLDVVQVPQIPFQVLELQLLAVVRLEVQLVWWSVVWQVVDMLELDLKAQLGVKEELLVLLQTYV
jgi:hypothetical protein